MIIRINETKQTTPISILNLGSGVVEENVLFFFVGFNFTCELILFLAALRSLLLSYIAPKRTFIISVI